MINDFKTKHILRRDLEEAAERFRKKYSSGSIPIDMEEIVELKLEMQISPIPELKKICDAEAMITSSWKEIYVDKESYMEEKYFRRLRFSLAHEIGHFVLHKSVYSSFNINSFEDFYSFYGDKFSSEEYGKIEIQANMFASFLLIPRDTLRIKKKEFLNKYNIQEDQFSDKQLLNSYIAKPLSDYFEVNEDPITIALNYL